MNKAKILTIDDSADMLFLEKAVLEREGYEVLTASDAETALEMFPQIKDLKLILCDVQMDNMDGLEFVERFEANHKVIFDDTPVVLVTALDKMPKAHVAGFINKIAGLDEFAAKVKDFIATATTQAETRTT